MSAVTTMEAVNGNPLSIRGIAPDQGSGGDRVDSRINSPALSLVSPATSHRSSISTSRIPAAGNHPHLEGNLKWLLTLECSLDVMCCRFSTDGSLIAVGQLDGIIKVFSTSTGQCYHSLSDQDILSTHLPATCIRFKYYDEDEYEDEATKHILIATYASGMIKFWHYTSGSCLHTINEPRQILATSLSPDGQRFVTAGADTAIHVYDVVSKKRIQTCEPSDSRDIMNGHRSRVLAIQYHLVDPHVFVSGGWDDTVQFWDDREKHAVRKISGPHICGDSLDVDCTHNHILTGSWRKDNVLQIWDFGTGKKIKDVPQDTLHSSQLYCAQWVNREFIVCGGTDQNMARVIDRGTLNTIGQVVDLSQGVYSIDNDRRANNTKIAICACNYVHLIKHEKK